LLDEVLFHLIGGEKAAEIPVEDSTQESIQPYFPQNSSANEYKRTKVDQLIILRTKEHPET